MSAFRSGTKEPIVAIYEAIFHTTPSGILIVDPQGKTLFYNRQFSDLWKIPPRILKTNDDQTMLDFVLNQLAQPERFIAKVEFLYKHPQDTTFDKLPMKDGRTFSRYSSPLIDDAGAYYGRLWDFRDVTTEEESQKKIAEERILFQNLFDNIADAIYILDENGKFLDVNAAAWQALGYSRQEILKLTVKDINSPKTKPTVVDRIKQSKSQGSIFTTEHVTRSGKIIPVEINAKKIDYRGVPARLAICRDLTETQATERRFRLVFDSVADPMFIIDAGGKIYNSKFLDVNEAATRVLEYSQTELLQFTSADLEVPDKGMDLKAEVRKRRQSIRNDPFGSAIFAVKMRTKTGKILPFEIHTRIAKIGNRPIMISIARDLTESNRLAELEETNRAKDEFLNIAAHELRTPLTSIIGLSEIISQKSTALEDEPRRYAQIIHDEGERLNRTIKQILEVTRFENRLLSLQKKPECLNEIILGMKPVLDIIAQSKNATIIFQQRVKKLMVQTDKERISQVIYDLIDNAVKFGPTGQTVTVSLSRPTKRTAKIEVIDQGPGIPEDQWEKIFTKFGRVNNALSRTQEGIGLGLYTAKLIVQSLGGQIGLNNLPEKGADFWFTLPLD